MIKPLFAALALVCLSANVGGAAQNANQAEQQMAELAAYAASLKPVIESINDIMIPTDEADLTFTAYLDGKLDREETKLGFEQNRSDIARLAAQVGADFNALPPPPKLSLIPQKRIGVVPEDIEAMIIQIEAFSFDLMNLYDEALDGNEEALYGLGERVYDRAEILISVGNTILRADAAAITDRTHPQIPVINATINSNDLALVIMNLQRALILDGDEDAYRLGVSVYMGKIAKHEQIIQTGNQNQRKLLKLLRDAKVEARASEQSLLNTVTTMVKAYDEAWRLEQNFVDDLNAQLPVFQSDPLDYDAIDAAIILVLDQLGVHETTRIELIFARVAMISP